MQKFNDQRQALKRMAEMPLELGTKTLSHKFQKMNQGEVENPKAQNQLLTTGEGKKNQSNHQTLTIERLNSDNTREKFTVSIKKNQLVKDLKKEIAKKLKVEVKHVILRLNNVVLQDQDEVPASSNLLGSTI